MTTAEAVSLKPSVSDGPYRVLHVTECYAGGVSRAIEGLVEDAPNVEHHLLYAGNERPLVTGAFDSVTALPEGFVARVKRINETVKRIGPDAVHLHSSWAGVYGRIVRTPTRVIYQPHCYAFEDISKPVSHRNFFRLAERVLGSRTDVVVAVSERERALAKEISPRAEVAVVPNKSRLPVLTQRIPVPLGPRRVVMIGRLVPQKDPDWFAAVARRAMSVDTELQFVWIGDGDSEFRRRLESTGVRVTGWLDEADLVAELDAASVYLHSAVYEGFPLSVLDAAARCVPALIRSTHAFDGLGILTVATVRDAAEIVASPDHTHLELNTLRLRSSFPAHVGRIGAAGLYDSGVEGQVKA